MVKHTCECGVRWEVRRSHDTCPECGRPTTWVIEEPPQHCGEGMWPRWAGKRWWQCRVCDVGIWPDGQPVIDGYRGLVQGRDDA